MTEMGRLCEEFWRDWERRTTVRDGGVNTAVKMEQLRKKKKLTPDFRDKEQSNIYLVKRYVEIILKAMLRMFVLL